MNFGELFKRAIKYIVEGIIVAIAAYVIPKQRLNVEEVVVVALVAASTFAVLDTFIPLWEPPPDRVLGLPSAPDLLEALK